LPVLSFFSVFNRLAVALPERARRMAVSVLFIAVAVIFVFAFFDKAGTAGNLLLQGTEFLLGRVRFLVPGILLLGAFVLWGMRKYNMGVVFAMLGLFVSGMSGVLGSLIRFQNKQAFDAAGLIGGGLSWLAFSAFGFWVSEVLFSAAIAVCGVVLWQLLPHEKMEEGGFAQATQEKIRKIFEPKLRMEEVETVPTVKDGSTDEEEEEEKEGKAKKKGKTPAPKAKPLFAASMGDYKAPGIELLDPQKGTTADAGDVKTYSAIIKKTLQNFDIPVEVSEVNVGPAVAQYAFKPAEGIKLSRITALQNDLALALAAHPIRIEAPIPGRALVGVEIPNKVRAVVGIRELFEAKQFQDSTAPLLLALGKDVSGAPIFADLAKMPHLLVAGATGSGKTIGLNNIIISLIYRNPPSNLRLILVDPKRVEFPVYNDLPHMLTPVILDTQRTVNALKWLLKEMDRRFQLFSEVRVRDIGSYHALQKENQKKISVSSEGEEMEEVPYIVAVLDELADLMAVRGKEIEGMIVRLAQMARAVGIHLVLATQRPSVEVITGLIKANITSRVAFQVASQIDSRTILDMAGAEKLLGRGDMLFVSSEFQKPRRIQGAYISDKEVKKIVETIAQENESFDRKQIEENNTGQSAMESLESRADLDGEDDPLYEEAKRLVLETRKASASFLQRRLKLGYARAARLLDILEEKGIVGPSDGAKPREVYGNATSDSVEGIKEEGDWETPKL